MDSHHLQRIFDREAPRYGKYLWLCEKLLFGRYRKRLLTQASGRVLEVGIGTGLNLQYYPSGCAITGIDLSQGMLGEARKCADSLGLNVSLIQMNAERLEFEDESFDTVVATLALCTIPNPVAALSEMRRVVKPDGKILLFEHVVSCNPLIRKMQDMLTPLTYKMSGCHLNRDTIANVGAAGLSTRYTESHLAGIIRLVHATKQAG
jgi:ubiquinone/menaquinone biosynthesis C-methylase UbiE